MLIVSIIRGHGGGMGEVGGEFPPQAPISYLVKYELFGTLIYGCTEKPDTVRYADTVRYRTDSRGRFSISRGDNRAS